MKSILINTVGGGANWTGGLYYARNIAFELTQNQNICSKYKIYIYSTKENAKTFRDIPGVKMIVAPFTSGLTMKLHKIFICKLYNVKYLYWGQKNISQIGTQTICWIPDFQHKYLKEFFTSSEIAARDQAFSELIESNLPLVLSSATSFEDYRKFYGKSEKKAYIVPFVSYIEPLIRQTTGKEEQILQKFGLKDRKYACVMNQFWQHKNHLVVFEALKEYCSNHPNSNFEFVFTGKMEDYRNPEYIQKIKGFIEDPQIHDRIKLLGFISREEQIVIMKNASFIIQPSLFEGWGTVLEDAKVLDKTVLLSKIPIHMEQKNEKCFMFDPYKPEELAELISVEAEKEHYDDLDKGIAEMYQRAKLYSKGFEELLLDSEKG